MNPRVPVAAVTVALVTVVLVALVPVVLGAGASGVAVSEPLAEESVVGEPFADEPAVGEKSETTRGSPTTAHDGPVLQRTTELRHAPDRPGEFDAVVSFEVPDSVTELEIRLEEDARNASADGFERSPAAASAGGAVYEWTGETDAPEIRFTVPANRTAQIGHHEHAASAGDGYTFVDTGSWGVVAVPQVELTWRGTEATAVEGSVEVDGPGAAGESIAYFGEIEEYERTVRGETLRLAVPAAADLAESPEDVLDALAFASDELRVGARNDEVFLVAIPTEDVDLAAEGVQYGEGDAWVVDDAELETAPNVWLHEYVHTRQAYANHDERIAPETRWLIEAQAEYYAAALALEKGLIEFEEFERFLDRVAQTPFAESVLADPGTWNGAEVDYVKGPLVYGTIDRELRDRTDGEVTTEAVFRDLNAVEGELTEREFLASIEERGGSDVRDLAEGYVHSTDAPEPWSANDHDAVFGGPTSAIEYSRADDEPVEIEGPTRTLSEPDVPTVLVDETVTIPVVASNVGDAPGTYEASLWIDDRVLDSASGTLDPDERRTERLSWTPEEPGTYEVVAGDRRTSVLVREPADGAVTALEVDRERVQPGEPVRVTATVENADAVHADVAVEFRTADGVVEEKRIALEPGGKTVVETDLVFEGEARHEIAVGDRTETVLVTEGGVMETGLEEMADAVPGFGAFGTIVGIVVLGALVRWRARSEGSR